MLITNIRLCTRLNIKYLTSMQYCKVYNRIDNPYMIKNVQNNFGARNLSNSFNPSIILIRKNSFNCRILNVNSKLGRNLINIRRNAKYSTKTELKDVKNVTKKVKLRKSDVKRLFSLAKSEKFILVAAIGCLVVSSTITMSVPFALGKILDIIFNSTDTLVATKEKLKNFCLILCGVFLIGGIANFGRVYLFNSASLRIVNDLRARVYKSMLNQEVAWFDTKGTGELLNRLSTDTYLVGNSLSQNVSDGLRSSFMIVIGAGMMIYTSPHLALVSVTVVPCIAGMAILYGRYVRNITRSLLDKYADISKSAEERLGNIKTVKIFCKEDQESQSYLEKLIDALQLGYKDVLARATFYGLTGMSGNIIIMSVLYYGGNLVVNEDLSIGALTSFILYAAYSAISLNGLTNFYTELNKGIGSAQRLWEILDRKNKISLDEGIWPKEKPKGEINFENIFFTFPSRPNSTVLKNFSLNLEPGTITAIVGRSGSGKTTIATLLLRLYDPQEGRITLDGMDLRTVNPRWLRSHIGAVNQEPVLFSGTIRENILYGLNPGSSFNEDEFKRVVREAYVDEFVAHFPEGMDTIVGQRGMMLSGGQKQRIAIARALIKNPTILILDEATSALDSVSEELVQNALEKLTTGRTVLTIAHRLSTIRNADQIVVLDQGSICEEGRYEDLISKESGIFKELIRKQAFESITAKIDRTTIAASNQ